MKKINSVVLSTLTAALLIGCGGGGSESSSSGSSSSSSSSTDVTVERGPVLGAIVTDANGQKATQKAGTNVYSFATTPKYPISAIGGVIDVDGNGIDEGDVELTTVLESYSTIITPITTYIGNPTSQEGLSRISELKTIMGSDDSIRDEDLLKIVPSEVVNNKVLFLTNAIYSNLMDTSISISSKYNILDDVTALSKKELKEKLEEQVITDLGSYTINAIEAESKKTEVEKTSDTKLVFTNNTEYISYTTGEDSYDSKRIYLQGDKLKLDSTNWFKNENVYNPYFDALLDIKIDASNPSKFSYVDENAEEGTVIVQETKKITSFNGQPFQGLSSDIQELSKSILKRVVTKAGTGIEDSDPTPLPDGITTIEALLTYEEENNSNYFDTELDTIKPVSEGSSKYVTISENGKHKVYYEIKQNLQDSKYYLTSTAVAEVGYTEYETVYSGDFHVLRDLESKIRASAPTFKSVSSINIAENQTTVTTINALESGIKYSLSGTDAKLFNINESTGAITFKVAPDFEATPTKNQYKIKINATNSFGKTAVHELTVNVTDVDDASTLSFVSGDIFKGLVYNVITSPVTNREWLDRNLGASQACTSSTDTACYGDYYQWGRLADGHEKSTSTTTTAQASTISNVGNQFVTVMGDWTTEDSDGSLRSTLWSKTDGTGICPVGFRVPTSEEVTAEEITSSTKAFTNLKFPVAGARFLGTGALDGNNVWGDVWTSSSSTTAGKSYYTYFEGNESDVDFEYRADGRSVRCIKGN